MEIRKNLFKCAVVVLAALATISCSSDDPGEVVIPEVYEAELTALTVTAGSKSIESTLIKAQKVADVLYIYDDLEWLKAASITVEVSKDAVVTPDPSGTYDFTQAGGVKFTVTSKDGKETNEWTVEITQAETSVSAAEVWKKSYADLGITTRPTIFGGAVAFSGSNFVTFDGSVYDMDGQKLGTLNKTGSQEGTIICLSNDENGVLVGSLLDVYSPTDDDNSSMGTIWAWKDGWQNAPTKLYANTTGNVTRYMSIAGDVNGDAILTVITGGRAAADQTHHCFVVTGGDWPNLTWHPFVVPNAANDGNWGQMVSAASGDPNGVFFIWDSQNQNEATNDGGALIYTRQGIQGIDTPLYGTLWDDGLVAERAHAGTLQYGNLTGGHVRGFMFDGVPYVIVSSTSWPAARITIQPADAENHDYILRTQSIDQAVPVVSSAYLYNKETGVGEVLFLVDNAMLVKYEITRELI